ncbi:cytochrome P450 [Extensimonas sp. H3M7-6]|uniref:cytochrome P450 n=1 Tax=Extensimonas soli TaxID=3031322 RepID=UPI0023DACA12|nr:cytochrome P450 [Extensimonas sp. H3M7-6]MDF1483562.1 cytochrome P450 [Extensimonas sp. H3M7-6]
MMDTTHPTNEEMLKRIRSTPIGQLDVADTDIFRNEAAAFTAFDRLRREDPVHYCATNKLYGPYWSITKFKDIVEVETKPQIFSSEAKGITIEDNLLGLNVPMFIAMDPPKHDEQRMAVSPSVAPDNLAKMEAAIYERTRKVLDGLPIGETFNWVDRVSIELTTQMLAILFDFPWEDRRKLTRWSEVASASEESGSSVVASQEQRMAELGECLAYFTRLWNERVNAPPKFDLISMLAHSPATRNMPPMEYLGNLLLLIVGGNDTTRNSMSGGLLALNRNPEEYRKLCARPELVSTLIPEIIRWQTPLTHMRRTALEDATVGGKQIHKGDKVVMWYLSGNRDPEAIEQPDSFIIDRARPRQHLSFGFGIHRCLGNRLAEMQLRILWEEILKRWNKPMQIEVVGEPVPTDVSILFRGLKELPVRINA